MAHRSRHERPVVTAHPIAIVVDRGESRIWALGRLGGRGGRADAVDVVAVQEETAIRRGGRGAPGGVLEDRSAYSCNGGDGGEGGYGGPGRGGDSIGIAYLDEDRLTVEGVTFKLRPPGKGGISWDDQGKIISGEDASPWRRSGLLNSWSGPRPANRVGESRRVHRPGSSGGRGGDRSSPPSSPHHPGPPRQRGAPAGGVGTSLNTSASGKERTSWVAAASCALGTSRKRAQQAADGRRVMACTVDLRQ
ncbi:hypothetical protein WMF04_32695 [Sorangium sp. So ce260]